MGIGEKFLHRFNDLFDLPAEVMLQLPLLLMVGGKSLILENHRGILEYSRERIRVRLNRGEILLVGENLTIKGINSEEIQISGSITELSFRKEVTVHD